METISQKGSIVGLAADRHTTEISMKFKRSDTCLEDYKTRRAAFIKHVTRTERTWKGRHDRIKEWMDENSPYEPHEKLKNLQRAIYGDERH